MPWEQADDGTGIRSVLLPDQASVSGIRGTMKIFVPMTSTDARKGSSRGLLLGSGGNTLRAMQSESKCKLTIKGKGSSKGSHEVAPGTDEEEDLHLLVEYDGPASGRDQVQRIIQQMLGHGTRSLPSQKPSRMGRAPQQRRQHCRRGTRRRTPPHAPAAAEARRID